MNRLALTGVALVVFLTGCSKPVTTGSVTVSQSSDGVVLDAVHRGDELLYAFAWPAAVPKMNTNVSDEKHAGKGIHLVYTSPDELYFDRRKVALPQSSKVFALLHDGTVVPIHLSEAELRDVLAMTSVPTQRDSVPEGPLKEKLLAPFKPKQPKLEKE